LSNIVVYLSSSNTLFAKISGTMTFLNNHSAIIETANKITANRRTILVYLALVVPTQSSATMTFDLHINPIDSFYHELLGNKDQFVFFHGNEVIPLATFSTTLTGRRDFGILFIHDSNIFRGKKSG